MPPLRGWVRFLHKRCYIDVTPTGLGSFLHKRHYIDVTPTGLGSGWVGKPCLHKRCYIDVRHLRGWVDPFLHKRCYIDVAPTGLGSFSYKILATVRCRSTGLG